MNCLSFPFRVQVTGVLFIKHSGEDSVVNSLKLTKMNFQAFPVLSAWYEYPLKDFKSEEFATKNLKILFN